MKKKPGLTINELIARYKPAIEASSPGRKPHDGSRPICANALKSPGPLPVPIKSQGEGCSASGQILEDRDAPTTFPVQRPYIGGQNLGGQRTLKHPGEILHAEFLLPLGLSQAGLARVSGIPARKISELVRGRRPVSPDLAHKLGPALRISPDFWLKLQAAWDEVQTVCDGRAPTLSNLKDGIRAHVAKKYMCTHPPSAADQRPEGLSVGDDAKRNADSENFKRLIEEISEEVREVRRERASRHSKAREAASGSTEENLVSSEDKQARLGIVGLKVYYRIMELWGLSDDEATALLGFGSHPGEQEIKEDHRLRISHTIGIYRALHALLPATADGWIRRPNSAPLFGGSPALDLLKTGTQGFKAVWLYLMAELS